MREEKIINVLKSLHQLDVDAIEAYEEAIETIENTTIKSSLTDFKRDHLEHVQNLEGMIVKLGGVKPDRSQDVKGLLIEGMTKLRSAMGQMQALKAMRQNEVITNTKYENALEDLRNNNATSEVIDLVTRHRTDEQRHLDYIVDCIEHPDTSVKKTA